MLITTLLALSLLPPQDWPGYRGPDHDGKVADNDWSPRGAAEPLWTTKVGKGYSGASIVGDRLVTLGYYEELGVDRIVCLDATEGSELWGLEFEATDAPRYHGGGTLTTPTLDSGRVYCTSREGVLRVLDLESGELLWQRDYASELGLRRTFHGFSASPLITGELMILQLGGTLATVIAEDGEPLWVGEPYGDGSYSNPVLLEVDGEPAIASVLADSFYVQRLDDGQVLYEYPWKVGGNGLHCASPAIVGEDLVFLSTAYAKGCALLRLGDQPVPELLWESRAMRTKVTACVFYEGHLYGFDESMLRCIDLEGNTKWRARGLGLGSLSLAGDRLIVLDSDGELIVAEATPDEFRELSRAKVLEDGVYWTAPVISRGRIYARNSLGDLACLDHRSSGAPVTSSKARVDVPAAAELFARNAAAVGTEQLAHEGKALRLRGKWSIPLRGLDAGETTLTLIAPDRWRMDLAEGGLNYAFDGALAWAIEPQGPRIIEGEEYFESTRLFRLPELFTPHCPEDAGEPRSGRFANRDCWSVASSVDRAEAEPARVVHWFDAASGRLVGSEGTDQSTLVFDGEAALLGLSLPGRITRFRAEDGQEHVLTLESAEWIDVPAELFEPPPGIQRILRTPEQVARDEAALRERMGDAMGRYQAEADSPFGDDVFELSIDEGSLWLGIPDVGRFRVDVANEEDGAFPVEGGPLSFTIERDESGGASALSMSLPDQQVRLARLED